jgi:hypothetical protein
LGIRLAWVLAQPVTDQAIDRLPDQREYISLAQNLLTGRGLQFYDQRFHDVVWAFRTPGYPAWIALWGAQLRLVRIAQAVLDTTTVLAAYLLAKALLNRGASNVGPLAAAVLVAVNPLLIAFSGLFLSETLFTAMLAWGMVGLVIGGNGARLDPGKPFRRGKGLALWLAGGLLLALSSLVRPSALPLPVLMGIAGVFLSRGLGPNQNWSGERAYYQRNLPGAPLDKLTTAPATWPPKGWPLPVGATMLFLTLLVITPWGFRNWRVLGSWIWTTTNEGVTAYDGFNPDATGASDQSFLGDFPQLQQMGELERSRYLSDKAAAYVRANPERAAKLGLLKAARTWSPVPLSREYGGWKHSVVLLVYSAPLDLMVVAALLGPLGGGMLRAAKVFLLLPAIYFTTVHMMSIGSIRYRAPVEPALAVVAAGAVAELIRMVQAAREFQRRGPESTLDEIDK